MDSADWELILLVVIIGLMICAGLSVFIFKNTGKNRKRIKELEGQLADTRTELTTYRTQVNNHFQKTSELFNTMTDSYKALYIHLKKSIDDQHGVQPEFIKETEEKNN